MDSRLDRLRTVAQAPNETPSSSVLMLPGSGQVDRDDNAKRLAINLLPQLVPALTARGFATFSHDKRTVDRRVVTLVTDWLKARVRA